MRTFVYETITGIQDLLVPDDRVYSSGSTGANNDSPTRPFIIIRSQTTQPGMRRERPVQQRFQVWLHNDPGSMLPTDTELDKIRDALVARSGSWWGAVFIMDVEWENTSPDLYDDHYKTNTRYAEFLITAKLS